MGVAATLPELSEWTLQTLFSSIFCLIRAKNNSRVLMFADRIFDVV